MEGNIITLFQSFLYRGGTHLMYIIAYSPLDSHLIKDFIQHCSLGGRRGIVMLRDDDLAC